ncbi:ribosome maturation factor RimM [Buchnera aphidicola]|uniref:Ribosome maturation factor RimM n=1 Tax=Buchnera aphidicola subsp. Cinara cedri (strain Cc) TaxID=372461 RepID=RIMM_BUCCC|nr:ribosome maturation factor RimM [Buchnera aphidicola]Q057I4.1 RecName: Full=Ribosome maturation factor RimM [Buchnera aphidicola BCc]ABJ90715.1 16s rRNA processing protein [Buchnera aphidicola BCc]
MITIGKIGKPYGILGWFHMFSYTEKKNNIFNYFPWKLEKSNILLYKNNIIHYKTHTDHFLIKIKDINNRTQTLNFIKQNILIKNFQLPKLKNKEYYWNDIFSCYIFDLKKKKIGSIKNIIDNKFYCTLEILYKKKKIYIPFIQPNFIKKIDIKKKIIVIDLTNLNNQLI